MLIGGGGPTVLDRVLAWADGWFPQWHDENLFARIAELQARADRPIQVQVLSVPPSAKALEQLAGAGVHRASSWLPSGPVDEVEAGLAKWEQAIADFTGR